MLYCSSWKVFRQTQFFAPEHRNETKWSQHKIDEDVLNKKNLSNQENATETVLSKVEKGDLVKKKLIKGGRTTGIKI